MLFVDNQELGADCHTFRIAVVLGRIKVVLSIPSRFRNVPSEGRLSPTRTAVDKRTDYTAIFITDMLAERLAGITVHRETEVHQRRR